MASNCPICHDVLEATSGVVVPGCFTGIHGWHSTCLKRFMQETKPSTRLVWSPMTDEQGYNCPVCRAFMLVDVLNAQLQGVKRKDEKKFLLPQRIATGQVDAMDVPRSNNKYPFELFPAGVKVLFKSYPPNANILTTHANPAVTQRLYEELNRVAKTYRSDRSVQKRVRQDVNEHVGDRISGELVHISKDAYENYVAHEEELLAQPLADVRGAWEMRVHVMQEADRQIASERQEAIRQRQLARSREMEEEHQRQREVEQVRLREMEAQRQRQREVAEQVRLREMELQEETNQREWERQLQELALREANAQAEGDQFVD